MEKSVQELAEYLQGTFENDNPELKITGVKGLVEAGPQDISFAVPPYVEHCHKSKAGVMVLSPNDPKLDGRPVIRVENPRGAFALLLELYRPQDEVDRVVSQYAFVHPTAKVGNNVSIQPFAYIEAMAEIGDNTIIYPHVYVGRKVKIGNDCKLYPNAVVREDCVLKNRVILQPGAVIGGDGFGYVDQKDGSHTKVLQTGNVILEDDVEVGCNSCVDRATVDSTIVGHGTKIDNFVQIGHNDIIGANNIMCSHVGIPGSVVIGEHNTFAGQAACTGHITIGNNNLFAGRAGVIGNVSDNNQMAGFPAQSYRDWLKTEANLRKIGDLLKKVKELEKEVKKLQQEK